MRYLFLLITLLAVSCSGLEKKIAKKWKVASFDITPGAEVTDQDRIMIEGSKTLFEDVVYSLEDDGEFKLIVSGNARNRGKYELNEEDSTIQFGVQGMKEKYKIALLTDSTLVLRSTVKPVEMKFRAQ